MDMQKEGELFEHWWENEGQYHRAGGNEYCKTFAWESWIFAKSQTDLPGQITVTHERLQELITIAVKTVLEAKE
ncbi:MAG TPA: hypothetical protein PLA93_00230 [Acinetobacter towneri]|nr:hypothetical protein [Acinetobacter towneri]